MKLLSWVKRKTETIAKDFRAAQHEYEVEHPRETANAATQSGLSEAIPEEACTHPQVIYLSGFARCQNCGAQNFGAGWMPVHVGGKTGAAWKQSPQHPTNWNELPVEEREHGTVYSGFVNGQAGFVERRADRSVIAERGATNQERRNQHVAALRGKK
jgi:hypothetical protein